ncbi:hypothetical protein [Pleomorphomonas koreensis]|uniref:hypothetical protein n=1 Tax=Pleomorphomonas koreensis TaxID=257440 RepID=UPI000420B018|nr:hypothetical protein [Pleomorphomonas koreensis]
MTPWLDPADFRALGYAMILYPTTVLFGVTKAIERTLDNLRGGRPLDGATSVDMKAFEELVDLPDWAEIEARFQPKE